MGGGVRRSHSGRLNRQTHVQALLGPTLGLCLLRAAQSILTRRKALHGTRYRKLRQRFEPHIKVLEAFLL